jgi:hypothetical protein
MSGNGNGGTWSGTPAGVSSTYYASGKVGLAGVFDGGTDYVGVPSNSNLNVGAAGTFCLWVNPNSSWGNFAIILQKWTGYRIQRYSNTNSINFYDGTYQLHGGTITTGTWNYICVSVNNGVGIGYINGSQVFSGTVSSTLPSNGSILDIGGDSDGWFPGLIDDVRIYSRALSASEISALYNAEK